MVSPSNARAPRSVFSGQRGLIAAIAVFSLFINVLILTVPLYMLQLFERVMVSHSYETLTMLATIAMLGLIAYFCFDIIRQRLLLRLGVRIEKNFNAKMLSHQLNNLHRGDPQSARALHDLRELRSYVSGPSFLALLDSPWAIVYVTIIFMFHFDLGMIALVGLVILFVLGVVSDYMSRNSFERAMEASATADNLAQTYFRTADAAHSMAAVGKLVRQWSRPTDLSMSHGARAGDTVGVMSAAARFVRMVIQIALLSTGVVLVMSNMVTPGVMIAAAIIGARALAPVEQSITTWRTLVSARRAYARVKANIESYHTAEGKLALPEPNPTLLAQAVTVMLPGADRLLLHNVSFEIMPGEALGIIGPSGSGKTTLARVLCGLDQPSRGEVRLDGSKLSDWPAELLGEYVGYLPQRVELLNGTVAENISFHDPDADPKEIIRAAHAAHSHEMILQLPKGYNTDVGSSGDWLSAGQRQIIALARTFYGNRRLVILDEPNSNLDPDGEESLAKAVVSAKERGCALVLITHRPAILRQLDKLIVLNNGTVSQYGTPDEVFKNARQQMLAQREAGHLSVVTKKDDAGTGAQPGSTRATPPPQGDGATPANDAGAPANAAATAERPAQAGGNRPVV